MIRTPRWTRLAAALLLTAVVVLLSVLPGVAAQGDEQFQWNVEAVPSALQNSMHLVLYGMLFCGWAWAVAEAPSQARRLLVAGALVGLGLGLEWVQLQVPGRFASVLDAALNTAGVLCGYVAWQAWRGRAES
ncbi:MAG: VanZ family protein [Pseudohaliea sp.]